MMISLIFILGMSKKTQIIKTNSELKGKAFIISIEEGKNWIHKMPIFPLITLHNRPQMAIWLEDMNGNFIQNIYITEKTAKQNWKIAPGDKIPNSLVQRPEALPIWLHKQDGFAKIQNQLKNAQLVTSSTPKKSLNIETKTNSQSGRYVVCAEINHSTDFNETYKKSLPKNSEYYNGEKYGNGQPSLLYKGIIDLNKSNQSIILNLAGSGSPNGQNGEIQAINDFITTAKTIVKRITVYY